MYFWMENHDWIDVPLLWCQMVKMFSLTLKLHEFLLKGNCSSGANSGLANHSKNAVVVNTIGYHQSSEKNNNTILKNQNMWDQKKKELYNFMPF